MLDELEGQRATSAFVAVDGGGHEDEVGADKVADERKRNCGGFVDDDELCLAENVCIFRLDVLTTMSAL